jgi:hypothetical protein
MIFETFPEMMCSACNLFQALTTSLQNVSCVDLFGFTACALPQGIGRGRDSTARPGPHEHFFPSPLIYDNDCISVEDQPGLPKGVPHVG